MSDEIIHTPVLLKEVVEHLKIDPSGNYVDCTLGDGGYSVEILEHLETGILISIDYDQISIDFVRRKYRKLLDEKNWMIVRENFTKLEDIVKKNDLKKVDGVVFDLGMSSRQLDADSLNRGFSYLGEESLDMRMDDRLGVTADDLLKALSVSELTELFTLYGEERYAKRIAQGVKKWNGDNPDNIFTSDILAAIVRKVVPASYRKGSRHPARRVFQALRIAVNDELHSLQKGLTSALSIVSKGGRIVVVSYHSLEDRIVKEMFSESVQSGVVRSLTEKPIVATDGELHVNQRARSAKLRAVEKI